MGRAIGIDLGTTNTAVAVLMDGRPKVLEDERGYKVLPSCVSMKDDGRFVVGHAARNLLLTRPDHTIYAVKRLMGRRYDAPEVESIRRRLPFRVEPAPDGTCLVGLGDSLFSPIEISALVLQVARNIAEKAVDGLVDEVVITVPAYFNHAQRAATFEAARIAGLKCERLLNEPTAAALAYGFRKDIERTIVIYDLGGGTFDVSVLRLSQGIYEILATRGDTFLGGEDFDHRVVDHLANHFESTVKVDLREDRTTLQRLKDASERAKCELSFTDRTTVLIPRVTQDRNLEQIVTRLTLETLVEDLVQRTLEIVRKAVGEAGLKISDIDDVILVGGQTRMPRVREAVAGLFKKEPSRTVHPEEAVAVGAAVHANSLVEAGSGAPVLIDVTPFDLGIDVIGGLFQPIVARNSQVPVSASRSFATVQDNQDSVKVIVRQGYGRVASENEFLGEFVLSGLTPAPRMQTKVEVTFRLDTNGMLHVTASEPATGERKRITVRNYAEVITSKGAAEAKVEGDVVRRAPAEAPAAAEESPAAPTASVATGKTGKIAGFFSRMSRRRKETAVEPALAAPVAPPLPDPLPETEAAAPEEQGLAPLDDAPQVGLGGLPVSAAGVGAAALSRIVLPEAAPDLPFDERSVATRNPLLDEVTDPEVTVNTVAAFGLAGESPTWDARTLGEASGKVTDAAVPAGPVTRGPMLSTLPPAEGKTWDFGLELPEDEGSIEDFDKLFGDVEAFGLGVDEPAPRPEPARPEPPRAPPPRPERAPPPAPAPPPATAGGERGAGARSLGPRPIGKAAPRTQHTYSDDATLGSHTLLPVNPDADTVNQGDSLFDLFAAGDDAFAEPAPAERTDEVDQLFALADELFATDEPPRRTVPARRSAPPPPPAPAPAPAPAPPPAETPRKPARLKLAYPRMEALVAEYRENLRRGGCFVKTDAPLALGREVRIEVRAPGLDEPLELFGVVTASQASGAAAAFGQAPGMTIEYRLTPDQRWALTRVLGG